MEPLINQDADAQTPLSFYRVAFILCKAVTLSLTIRAFLGAFSTLVALIFNAFGYPFFLGNVSWVAEGLVAVVLSATAPSLSAAMVGQSTLEGEAIAARRALPIAQKSLVRAGAGLILLVFSGAQLIAGVPSLLLSPARFGAGSASFGAIGMMVGQLAAPALQVAIGFGLAFWPALRRSVQNG